MWIAEKIYFNNYSGYTKAYQGSELVWEKPTVNNALIFTAKQANSTIGLANKSSNQTVEYSTDNATWNTMTTATTITLATIGDKVYLRGVLSANNTSSNYTRFTLSGNIKASGNINYIWNYNNLDAALKNYCGYYMFSGCTALTDIAELELPATTLAERCYSQMFRGCSNFTTAPELPATTLASYCYNSMFQYCTSLVNPPSLPATNLASYCYSSMLRGCTSLTTAPSLPATTLAMACYYYMFYGCTNLTTAPMLIATTLVNACYNSMFANCSNLNYIKCLATDISATDCTINWVANVASSGTFVKDPNMNDWTIGNNGIPTNWITKDPSQIQSISISGETEVFSGNTAVYTVNYTPSSTEQTGVTWGIYSSTGVVTANTYASIDVNTGVLTVLSGARFSSLVTIVATSIVDSSITDILDISVMYEEQIDFTKKHWWTATSGSYNFNLPTRWNNGYYVEIDQYFTATGNTSSVGSVLRQQDNNSPFEIFYNSGYYFDVHYPNSTSAATVNTSDYDHRVSFLRTVFNNSFTPNVKYRVKYQVTPTHGMWVYSGSTLVRSTTYSNGDKNYCTTQDYSIYPAGCYARSGWAVIGDIRVYDNNNTLIHNFQLYPNPNSNNKYQYYDRIAETWYPVVFGAISKVETTNR